MKNILRPSKVKIILSALISLALVLAIFFLPVFGFSSILGGFTPGRKIASFLLSWIISSIIYYPLASGLVYLASSIKNSIYRTKEIILALVFIAIFNPVTLSLIISQTLPLRSIHGAGALPVNNNNAENNIQPESVCGFRVNEVLMDSKMREAGVEKGDIILKLNGVQIKSVQDIFKQLDKKKPGDKVSIETDKGSRTVELVKDSSDPNHPVLGVKLEPNLCEK